MPAIWKLLSNFRCLFGDITPCGFPLTPAALAPALPVEEEGVPICDKGIDLQQTLYDSLPLREMAAGLKSMSHGV